MSETIEHNYQSDADDVEIISGQDYVFESHETIYNNSDIKIENALVLNKQMQSYLASVRSRLEDMLKNCRNKYKQNEALLVKLSNKPPPELAKARRSHFFCGYPYFKNRDAFSAPPPAEFLQRRNEGKELFPLLLDEYKSYWTNGDKVLLIQAVKSQLVKFLHVKNKDRVRYLRATDPDNSDNEVNCVLSQSTKLPGIALVQLLAMADSRDFKIDWFSISTQNLNNRHTQNGCIGMWDGYLKPTLNRSPWTLSEEDNLLNIVNLHSNQNWPAIAEHIKNRSPYQCLVQYCTVLSEKNMVKNMRWTEEEDAHLLEIISKYRIGDIIPWTKVLESMPGRYKAQLYNRYMFTLNPAIKREKFTVEEDCILMAAVDEYGTNFQNFPANMIPGRTIVQIRNRYNNVLQHVGKVEHWTAEHDQQLVSLVETHGKTNWVKIAEEIKVHSRFSCRSRYNTIVRYLQKHPQCTVVDVPRRKKGFSSKVTTNNWMEMIIRQKQKDKGDYDEVPIVDKQKDERRLMIYINNDIGFDYYEYFKFAYDFSLGERKVVPNNSQYETLRSISNLLDIHYNFDSGFSEDIKSDFITLKELPKIKVEQLPQQFNPRIDKQLVLPPNYRSIIGLRGLSIMFDCNEHKGLQNTAKKRKTLPSRRTIKFDNPTGIRDGKQTPQQAIALFKKRFKLLFQTAAILSHIPPFYKETSYAAFGRLLPQPRKAALQVRNNCSEAMRQKAITSSPSIPRIGQQKRKGEQSASQPNIKISTVQRTESDIYDYTVQTDTGVFRITIHNTEEEEEEEEDIVMEI